MGSLNIEYQLQFLLSLLFWRLVFNKEIPNNGLTNDPFGVPPTVINNWEFKKFL